MRRFQISLLILGTEALLYNLRYFYAYVIFGLQRYRAMDGETRSWLIQVSSVLICLAVTIAIHKGRLRQTFASLGLRSNVLFPFLAALVCSLPMFIGFGRMAGFRTDAEPVSLIATNLWVGFNEELIFRGFIAGLLIREAKWHFIPALLVSGACFGLGHLYQAASAGEGWMIFGFTLLVNAGFFSFYRYCNWNMWFVIFLHGLMDMAFSFFPPANNVLLNGPANVYRGLTIALGIVYCLAIAVRTRKRARIISSGNDILILPAQES